MKSAKAKNLIAVAAICLTASLAACCNTTDEHVDNSLQNVLDAGQLVMGIDNYFPPMSFTDEDGNETGFDIDVATEVCNRLGIELVLYPINWDEKTDDLNTGIIDCIWSGLSATPLREQEMLLSKPYMKNELIILVPRDSTIMNNKGLAGATVGVQAGTTAQDVIEASDIYDNIKVKTYSNVINLIKALDNKEIEAVFTDSTSVYYFVFSNENTYYILPDSLEEEEYAIAFRKTDNALCTEIERIMTEMKYDGTLGEISEKWFGSDITIIK